MGKPPAPERPRRSKTIPPAMHTAATRPFPRAVPTYVGRDAELNRALELLDHETLHLIYGVGGVGKSEFVYKLVEEASVQPRWIGAIPVLVAVRAGMAVEHVIAALRLVAGARRQRGIQTAASSSLDDDLSDVARLLDAQPLLVFFDDLHHLDPAPAARMLGYLSRHVRGSRLLVASRVEIPLPPGAPPPAIHRLGPLDERATERLVAQLTDRFGAQRDARDVFARSGGSPFYVLRELAGEADGSPSSLEQTLHELEPGARALLLALASARGRFQADELSLATDDASRLLRELARRFLVDLGRDHVMVHELVRDAVLRTAHRRELVAAHRQVAEIHRARLERDEKAKGAVDPTDAVDAIHHLVRAGEVDEAWELTARTYRTVAAAGLDHLLIDDLRTLAAALAAVREPIALMTARIQVRRSLIAEAAETLATLGDRGEAASQRWLVLSGEVAQRRGRLSEAEAFFRRAIAAAETAPDRFQTALALADVHSLRGHCPEAREVLEAALGELPEPSPRDRARWGWSMALSYVIEERFAAAAATARAAADGIAGAGLDDMELLLAMLEVLARCECDDIVRARALIERVVTRAVAVGALREHVVDLYSGLVRYFTGDVIGARQVLGRSFRHLAEHHDHVLASIGGYYQARSLLALGDIPGAIEMSAAMTRLATDFGLESLAPHGRAAQAEVHLVAGRLAEARNYAAAAMTARSGAGARFLARLVLARAAAIEGDLATARRTLAEAEAEAMASIMDAAGDAATIAAGRAALTAAADLERAGLELHGGDPALALASAERAQAHYERAERSGMVARAQAARAAALVVRAVDPARAAELALASELLDSAERIAIAGGHARVRCRVALVRGALLARRGDHDAAARVIATAAAAPWALGPAPAPNAGATPVTAVAASASGAPGATSLAPLASGLGLSPLGGTFLDHGEGRALRMVASGADAPPGVRALLSSLGLVAGARHRVTTRTGAGVVVDAELERVRAAHRVVVEPSRTTITATAAGETRVDRGRPLACELLAALVEAQGAAVSAEQLFLGVWGGHEYHPLRHRNTVYVAVKRLRQTLRSLLDDERELIETTAAGWRLADFVDVAVIRPVD